MQYLFHTPIPVAWLLEDVLTLAITLLIFIFVIQKSKHPVVALLEGFAFVCLYASIYENFAVVQGWYIYGKSLLMIGDVPLSVPLIEMDVVITTLWLLEKMGIPNWCKPFIVGFFGMLQDLSMDPVAVRQVFTVQNVTSGRWSWILQAGMVNIYNIPVYNFSGWMLILGYATIFILIGRWWFKRSGYKPAVGYAYPFLAILLALITLVTPLSQFLLWLGPFSPKGSQAEWVMLWFHLILPTILLAVFWRGRMKQVVTLKNDLPIFAIIILFHLADILFAVSAGFTEILWLILSASLVHIILLGLICHAGTKAKEAPTNTTLLFEP